MRLHHRDTEGHKGHKEIAKNRSIEPQKRTGRKERRVDSRESETLDVLEDLFYRAPRNARRTISKESVYAQYDDAGDDVRLQRGDERAHPRTRVAVERRAVGHGDRLQPGLDTQDALPLAHCRIRLARSVPGSRCPDAAVADAADS